MRARVVSGALLVGAVALVVTVDCTPDLGLAPFYCNNGQPECPDGYQCVGNGTIRVCVKEGASLGRDSTTPRPDIGIVADTTLDRPQPPDDAPRQDTFVWPDTSNPDVNNPPPPDFGTPTDSTMDLPRIGSCQSNADCANSQDGPCCCPILGLPIWGCLPLCLNPFCI